MIRAKVKEFESLRRRKKYVQGIFAAVSRKPIKRLASCRCSSVRSVSEPLSASLNVPRGITRLSSAVEMAEIKHAIARNSASLLAQIRSDDASAASNRASSEPTSASNDSMSDMASSIGCVATPMVRRRMRQVYQGFASFVLRVGRGL